MMSSDNSSIYLLLEPYEVDHIRNADTLKSCSNPAVGMTAILTIRVHSGILWYETEAANTAKQVLWCSSCISKKYLRVYIWRH